MRADVLWLRFHIVRLRLVNQFWRAACWSVLWLSGLSPTEIRQKLKYELELAKMNEQRARRR